MMKNLTITLSEHASADWVVKSLIRRAAVIDFLVQLLKDGEQSRVQLDNKLIERFGYCNAPTANVLMDWFITYGWVRSEVREEEFIDIDFDERYLRMKIEINKDGTATISRPCSNKVIIVNNPVIVHEDYGYIHVTGTRKVQVRRKYYHWVG